jgi:hypothetical protein
MYTDEELAARFQAIERDVRSLQAALDDVMHTMISRDLILETAPSRTDPPGEPQSTDQSPDYKEGYRDGYRDGPGAACACGAAHPLQQPPERTSSIAIGTEAKGGAVKAYVDLRYPVQAAKDVQTALTLYDLMYSEYTTRQANHRKPTEPTTPEAPA